ncbi:MAG: futalosine hydrolase [Ferruginibacter sp.]|nr:futalosine hydrolase [Ferruginibacter sp.]
MQILLVAATSMEIAPFLQQKPAADHLITGVGCPSAIYHITQRLHQIDYDLVILAGIAGSYTNSLNLGDVVAVTKDNFADVGVLEKNKFYTIFEKGFTGEDEFPFSKGWLNNDNQLLDQIFIKKVTAVTVNTVTDDELRIRQLVSKYDPQIETMEGAALHYVCLQNSIPFLQLRGISNYVGERDKVKWKIAESVEQLNEDLIKIYDALIT